MGFIMFSAGKDAASLQSAAVIIRDVMVYIGGRSGRSTTEISCVLARA